MIQLCCPDKKCIENDEAPSPTPFLAVVLHIERLTKFPLSQSFFEIFGR
jgi:hypothetical protein